MNENLKRTIAAAKMQSEKGQELSITTLKAFGIELTTRYGKCDELIEMLGFARALAATAASAYVKDVFYDTRHVALSLCLARALTVMKKRKRLSGLLP